MAERASPLTLFRIAVPICATVGALGIVYPKELAAGVNAFTQAAFQNLDWFFLLVMTGFLGLCLFFVLSRYGTIKLGKVDEEPEFSTTAWLAMLFAAGMGSGLMFWGVAEPMLHYTAPPMSLGSPAADARRALVITNFHWGLHAWACYAMGALVLAYFRFRRGTNYLPGAPLRSAFTGVWVEPASKAADLIAVLAVAFGVCGSIAMGSLQFQTGLGQVLGTDTSAMWVRGVILLVLFAAYTTSAATSLDKGIKILSQTNMALAIAVLLFLVFAGPTADLMRGAVTAIGDYLVALPELSFSTWPHTGKSKWFHGWTIVYFIWWIAWTPFVGIFIARISRGRTIREFMLGVVLAPTAFTIVWFAVFGGVGIVEELNGGGVAAAVKADVTIALFQLYESLPLTKILGALSLMLVFVFLVTSVDSATYVLGMLTSDGAETPPTRRKLAWGIALGLMGGALLVSGDIDVIKALSISGAIPFTAILIIQVIALFRALRKDHPS